MVERTLSSMGTLRKITGIVDVVNAALAQRLLAKCTIQGDTRMTVSLERCAAVGTANRLGINRLMATGTIWH